MSSPVIVLQVGALCPAFTTMTNGQTGILQAAGKNFPGGIVGIINRLGSRVEVKLKVKPVARSPHAAVA
jgi:hypothetical protein